MSDIKELFIQANTDSCCQQVAFGINIYLLNCISLLYLSITVLVFVCVISNQSTTRKHVICIKSSVSVTPCCIKHRARWKVRNGITNNIADVVQSHIQQKKQGNEKEWWEVKTLKNRVRNIGGLHEIKEQEPSANCGLSVSFLEVYEQENHFSIQYLVVNKNIFQASSNVWSRKVFLMAFYLHEKNNLTRLRYLIA